MRKETSLLIKWLVEVDLKKLKNLAKVLAKFVTNLSVNLRKKLSRKLKTLKLPLGQLIRI